MSRAVLMEAVSRRAVACGGWRWMAGMSVTYPDGMTNRIALVTVGDYGYGAEATPTWMAERLIGGSSCIQWREHGMLPDLTDPATLGCLLALVREAWGCAVVTSPEYDYDDEEARQGANVIGWRTIETAGWWMVGEGASEAEALVAALEGAP